MKPATWIGVAALWAGVGVGLGAFGAHALKDRLVESDMLDVWNTAVRYHMWHALALVLYGLFQERRGSGGAPAACFLSGSFLFSGSLYWLALDGPSNVLGPITPIGGLLLMVGWALFAVKAFTGSGQASA